jgi:hypothetical protein
MREAVYKMSITAFGHKQSQEFGCLHKALLLGYFKHR